MRLTQKNEAKPSNLMHNKKGKRNGRNNRSQEEFAKFCKMSEMSRPQAGLRLSIELLFPLCRKKQLHND